MELLNRRALITGAGRGIGRAIAVAMARSGAQVALLGRTEEDLLETNDIIQSEGGKSRIFLADVTIKVEIDEAWKKIVGDWKGLDILVNNAGVQGPMGPMQDLDIESWWRTLEINVKGAFVCAHTVLPSMIEQGYGKIINLSGGGAVSPRPNFSAYSASKAAVVRLTETLACEVRPYSIDVNSIAPGSVKTRMLDERLSNCGLVGSEEYESALQIFENGGTDPEEVAELAIYLASSRSNGLSGRLISVVWDSWKEINIQSVMQTEEFTMRRIIKKDGESV